MDCWAHIDGKDYPIAYGWTLTEEFSETLDSATISLPHVVGNISLKPYDDVIIHDFGEGQLPPREYGKAYEEEFKKQGHFYRHMLCYSFTKERVFIDKIVEGNKKFRCYNYNIELVSETKGLEAIQLPNKTISQPIGTEMDASAKKDEISGVVFKIAGTNYTLPYSVANDWREGLLVKEVKREPLSPLWRRWFLFGGDVDTATSDYMKFTAIMKNSYRNERFTLPDFSVSGITLAFGTTYLWAWDLVSWQTYHPIKHWIIRKKEGTQQGDWSSRSSIVQTIQNYLNGTLCQEIIADYESQNSISTISTSLPDEGDYEIYMYIEPQIVQLYSEEEEDWGQGPEPVSYGEFNIFGMTDNTDGNVSPVSGESDATVPFLAKWEFSISDETRLAKGVLTVYEAVRQALELYSPYIKVCNGTQILDGVTYNTWEYIRKYSLSDDVKTQFSLVSAPENQFNYPNLRDYITRLFYLQNCIPVVKDNVIGFMNLSSRNPIPFHIQDECSSYEQYSMDGSSYCDRLLRIYSDGLSRDNVVNCVERIGFKNGDSATLTLENMRLELNHPIYKIKKVYLCYYNTYDVEENGQIEQKMTLCKQDITPLVLLNSQRQLLSKEYIGSIVSYPSSIEELSKYYFATVGYDMGSRYITGWGMKYTAPLAVFWNTERSTIENILDFLMYKTPFGIGGYNNDIIPAGNDVVFDSNAPDDRQALDSNGDLMTIWYSEVTDVGQSTYAKRFGEFTQRLKSLMFIIEYQGFVSSSISVSKEKHDGNVVSRDNASSSLSFVESDGVNQKDKANRLGNASRTITARHMTFSSIQELATVWNDDSMVGVGQDDIEEIYESDEEHEDEVCFKKTISFEKDYFTASYFLCRNYVLRNYFTSVYSKHRPFPLASYEESVDRQENKTLEVLLSAESSYLQSESMKVAFGGLNNISRLLSFYKPSLYDSVGNIIQENGVDKAFYGVYPSNIHKYKGQFGFFSADLMKFTSGNSLCFVIPMKDNVSAGVYVSDFDHNLGEFIGTIWDKTWDLNSIGNISWDEASSADATATILTGARQNWYMFPVDPQTGMMYSMRFAVGFTNNDIYAINGFANKVQYNIAEAQLLPLLDAKIKLSNGKYQYFGQLKNDKYVGAGYPRLRFYSPSGNQFYRVSFEDSDTAFSYDECVIEQYSFSASSFSDYDGNEIGDREDIECLAEAIFLGRETELSEESPTCVFKDGKERITTTIQFEPISEDSKIRISPYFMKLSDAIGGKGKTYTEILIESNLLFAFSIANIISNYHYFENRLEPSEETYSSAIFSAPTLSIGIPEKNMDFAEPIELDLTFYANPRETGGPTYELNIGKIYPPQLQQDGSYEIIAEIYIKLNGQQMSGYQIRMVEITGRQEEIIKGISNVSDFKIGGTCLSFGAGYKTFALVEDRGFYAGGVLQPFPYKYSSANSGSTYSQNIEGLSFAQNSFVKARKNTYIGGEGGEVTINPYSFSDSNFYYENSDYTKFTLEQRMINGSMQLQVILGDYKRDLYIVGPSIGDPIVKPRNMNWVFMPELISIETESDLKAQLEGEILNLVPDEDIVIKTHPTRFTPYMEITLPQQLQGTGSIRLYYLDDDGYYHFVFGMNVDKPNPEYTNKNCIYPLEDGVTYRIYISFLDDRSRTVIDDMPNSSTRGDPVYRVMDFAQDENPPRFNFNVCVEK